MTHKIKNAVPRALLLDRVNAKDLSAKLTACVHLQIYSGVQRGQSVSVFFSPLVVFVSIFDRLLLGFLCARPFLYCHVITIALA